MERSLRQQIDEAFADYRDVHGGVCDRPHRSTNNGILYFSEKIVLLAKLGELTEADRAEYRAYIRRIEVEPGLMNRHPPKDPHSDQQGADDYFGRLAAARMGGMPELAVEVLNYHQTHRYGFNNVRPDTNLHSGSNFRTNWSAVLRKYPLLTATMRYAAGVTPHPSLALAWATIVAVSGTKGDPDSWIMPYLAICASHPVKGWLRSWAAERFMRRLFEVYPGGFSQVLAQHFEHAHPLARFWPVEKPGEVGIA